jgi:hypothetical protein
VIRRSASLLTLAALGLAWPARAQPEPRPLSEAIEVSEGSCIARAELLASVEVWLGRSAIDPSIRIQVEEAEPGKPRFVVLREGRPAAERRFKGGSIPCPDLRAAVALAIALAIDATILQSVMEPVPVPPPPPEPEPKPKPTPKPKPKAPRLAPRPRPAPEPEGPPVAGEIAAMVLLGVLPVPAWGGSVAVIVPVGPIALRVAAWATANADVTIGEGEAQVGMLAGEVAACLARDLGGVHIRGCAGAAGGGWSAQGRGYDVNRATAIPWIAATASLGAELPVSDAVALVARVHGYAPLARPGLEVSDAADEPVVREEAPPAGLAVSLGVMVGFP